MSKTISAVLLKNKTTTPKAIGISMFNILVFIALKAEIK